MSRTHKDKKWELRFPESALMYGTVAVPYSAELRRFNPDIGDFEYTGVCVTRYRHLPQAGAKTKKKKSVNDHWNWYRSTPSWWTRLFMNRPQRRQAHLWEKTAQTTDINELDDLDKPNVSHKPHKYYW